MTNYTISFHKVNSPHEGNPGEPKVRTTGFLIGIEPPIAMTQELVQRVFLSGAARKLSADEQTLAETRIDDAILVGSTDKRTTIYAHLAKPTSPEGHSETDVLNLTQNILHLMGVPIDHLRLPVDMPVSDDLVR
jgi:hypothetical protein